MRGITLWQPWASLVACGVKRIETRSWGTTYRGPLLIHAAIQEPPDLPAIVFEEMIQALGVSDFDTLPRGAVVAVADLARCDQVQSEASVREAIFRAHGMGLIAVRREFICGDFRADRWMWLLWDVMRLPQPIEVKGHQGLWRADERLVAQIREALPAWQR